ncbi:MAG: hypothetical protein V4502_06160 [Pseudomonadota bacterium]
MIVRGTFTETPDGRVIAKTQYIPGLSLDTQGRVIPEELDQWHCAEGAD